ncbi:MAG: hypothetical protein M1586_00970 [Patescibacteria group bacterium]|nr:hypothetical protein [Patescibacteria group bacterium]MCL5261858.1 hypothetical protein [Patescibacteria group bacterium]
MRKQILFIIFLIITVFCVWELTTEARQDPRKVLEVVQTFGDRLKNVSLLAPREVLAEGIKENYKGLVTQQLIDAWLTDPAKAPGRLVSSPWPDHIEIISLEPVAANSYKVAGKIIEVTSGDAVNIGFATKRPVTMIVEKINNRWLISRCDLGVYETTIPQSLSVAGTTGLVFDYPVSLGAEFIDLRSWPPELTIVDQPFFCAVTPGIFSLPERVIEKIINSKFYCVKSTSEGAAGSVYTTYVYSTAIGDQTISLTFTLRYPQCNNYIEPEKTLCLKERSSFDLDSVIAAIMASVRRP